MTLSAHELDQLFDEVMRDPRSIRGMDVEETCRILSELAKARVLASEYASTMRELERRYLDGFINTAVAYPGFADRIRKAINLHI